MNKDVFSQKALRNRTPDSMANSGWSIVEVHSKRMKLYWETEMEISTTDMEGNFLEEIALLKTMLNTMKECWRKIKDGIDMAFQDLAPPRKHKGIDCR